MDKTVVNKTIIIIIILLLLKTSFSLSYSENNNYAKNLNIQKIEVNFSDNYQVGSLCSNETKLYKIENANSACLGYTLFSVSTHRAAPYQHATLIDMNGTIIHQWNITGMPAKMLPGGSLIGSKNSRGIIYGETMDFIQESWDGNFEWIFTNWDDDNTGIMMARQHHDFQREGNPVGYYAPGQNFVPNGTTMILAHYNDYVKKISFLELIDDVIYEVDWNGNLTGFEWHAIDHFEEMGFNILAKIGIYFFPGFSLFYIQSIPCDWAHINSISLLGNNKWYEEGDQRFHPENIIISSRHTNIIAIIDRQTGKIVWKIGPSYSLFTKEGRKLGNIIAPHHAHIIPEGLPGEGNILLFDNGGVSGYGLLGVSKNMRFYSRVIEFNPINYNVVWEYKEKNFYCSIQGCAQRLPNGNTMITNGVEGKIFEVTPEKEIVWEYKSDSKDLFGKTGINRAYRIPPEWVPGNPASYDFWE